MASDRDANRPWSRDEALAYAYRRGNALRRRRNLVTVGAGAAVVALVVGAVAVVAADRSDRRVVSTGNPTTTTEVERPTSTTEPATTSTTKPAPTSTSVPATSVLDGDTPIDFGGIGPIRAGMTLRQAEQAAGVPLVVTDFEYFGGYCYSAYPQGMKQDVHITVLAPGDEPVQDPMGGIVGRVSAWDTMASPAVTDRGVGLGSSVDEVRAAYDGLRIGESPHAYVDGSYLDVHPPAGDRLLRFETNGGTVTAIHAGLPEGVTLIEGCA
jgi:hypothetical protein